MTSTGDQQSVLHPTALYTSAAEALSAMLPTTVPVAARLHSGPRDQISLRRDGISTSVSYVGQTSADAAMRLDSALLAESEGLERARVQASDILRPALEAATGVLGVGVLSAAASSSSEALLADADTVLFTLENDGRVVGWFALRLRENGSGAIAPKSSTASDVSSRLGRLHNVEMALTVEVGRTRMSVRDLLHLEHGAVVELDRSAGSPADILLNGRLIAHGEVVVMDQDYGVRITKILDSAEGIL